MTPRKSYQDQLPAGQMAAPLPCDHCAKTTPAWAIYAGVVSLGEPTGWICGGCIADAARNKAAAAWQAAKLPDTDWNSDKGLLLKAERNRLLDFWRWTIMPDSPLSLTGQAAFKEYLDKLQAMTKSTTTNPLVWVWPAVPELQYPPTATITATVKIGAK